MMRRVARAVVAMIRPFARAAVFGAYDGITASLGVILPAVANATLVVREARGVALAEFAGMGIGEWLSSSDNGLGASLVIGGASGIGVFAPATPYLFAGGLAALASSLMVLAVLGGAIAWIRADQRGAGRAVIETYAVLTVTYLLVWLGSMWSAS